MQTSVLTHRDNDLLQKLFACFVSVEVLMHLRILVSTILILLLLAIQCFASASADSTRYKISSLDSLSDEDLRLLEEYKDSFLTEIREINSTVLYKNRKPIDTTVANMNGSSHFEIGVSASGPIISNGRNQNLKGGVLLPSIMFYHKWGLYFALGFTCYTNPISVTGDSSVKLPGLYVTPGFYRTFFNKWSIGLSYSRSFIFYGQNIYRGLLNNSFALYNSFDFWRYITLSVNASVSWSSNLRSKKYYEIKLPPPFPSNTPGKKIYYSQLTRNAGQGYSANMAISLRKDFSFYNITGAKVFSITPDLMFLFGHDNNQILTLRDGGGSILSSDKFFGFLDIEPGFSAAWRIRNLEIFGAFHLAIPFNVYNYDLNKRVKNPKQYYPYGEGGVKYLFSVTPNKKQK